MGRRKIEIQPITHERNRSVTFLKRKNGLFKKAYELGVLCSVDVAVIVFEERPGHHLKLYQYGSSDIHEIIQRHLHHDGEKDTRGPADFSGTASGSKMDDGGDGDDDDGDDDGDDGVVSSLRGPKRRGDGQFKPSNTSDLMSTDYLPQLDYGSSSRMSHPQHPPRQLPPSISMSQQQQHQHPISSDRLGPMYPPHQSNKKPRLGIAPSTGLGHSRSPSDDPMPSSASPVSGGRSSARYPHSADPLSRNFSTTSGYLPHHVPSSVHHHQQPTSASSHSRHSQQQQQHPQYTPFFSSGGSGSYGQGGSTPPPPSFIPLQSQAEFSSSAAARGRSASSGSGVLPSRNVYGSYSVDSGGGGGPSPNSAGGSTGGSATGGGGPNGDILAALMDAEQQARATIARRNSASSGQGSGGTGSGFRLDWPVHVPTATAPPPGSGEGVPSKPASHSGSERGERERDGASGTSGGSVSGGGSGGGGGNSAGSGAGTSGTDWLDFLSGATANGAPAG